MNVRDIMTKDPACCMPESKLSEVARMMVERDCGQIPVVESASSMRPVGVVTDRDIIIRAVARGKNPLDLTARDVMTSPAVTVTPEITLEDCCETLESMQVRRVPVVDDDGACAGMVSQADIAQYAPKKLTAHVVRSVSQPVDHRGNGDQRKLSGGRETGRQGETPADREAIERMEAEGGAKPAGGRRVTETHRKAGQRGTGSTPGAGSKRGARDRKHPRPTPTEE